MNEWVLKITCVFSGNDIGDEGVRMINEAMKKSSGPASWFSSGSKMNTTLTSLNLSGDYEWNRKSLNTLQGYELCHNRK